MELTSSINDNVFTIKLLESLHLHNAQDFKYFFNSRVEKYLDIIIDLSNVKYIDEVGVACLFYCHEVAFENFSKIFIYKPQGIVKKNMQIMKCYEAFEIIDHKNLDVLSRDYIPTDFLSEKKLGAA